MTQKQKTKLYYRYSESGEILFTENQTKKRIMLCREALSNDKSYSTRFKNIYESCAQIEENAVKEFSTTDFFTAKYFELQQLGWGGLYEDYSKIAAPLGAFFPFVRTRFNSHQPVDEGCVWIGNLSSYPLIYVANNVARWVSPYSGSGFVRKEPFLPAPEMKKILSKISNRVRYPDLQVDIF